MFFHHTSTFSAWELIFFLIFCCKFEIDLIWSERKFLFVNLLRCSRLHYCLYFAGRLTALQSYLNE